MVQLLAGGLGTFAGEANQHLSLAWLHVGGEQVAGHDPEHRGHQRGQGAEKLRGGARGAEVDRVIQVGAVGQLAGGDGGGRFNQGFYNVHFRVKISEEDISKGPYHIKKFIVYLLLSILIGCSIFSIN